MKKVAFLVALVMVLSVTCGALAEFPLCNDGEITMTMFASRNASLNVPFEEHNFFKWMQELSGVKFDLTYVDSSAFSEKLNLMFTGNDLPEILFHCNPALSANFVMTNGAAGTLLPLNDLIDQYAPNLKALLDRDQAYWNSITLPDGNIYALPAFGLTYKTNEYTIINKVWLEKLGLEMPSDTETLYAVLKAFKEQDPNGNGVADEIPLCPAYGIESIKHFSSWFGLMHDVYNNQYVHTDDNNTVVFNPFQEEQYKAYLKFFRTLYQEGLLDNDVFVQTNSQVIAKGSGEAQLIGVSEVKGPTNAVSEAESWNYTVLPVLESPFGGHVYHARMLCVPGNFALTTACKNPEIAIKWVDYLYSQEGGTLVWMGKEGVTYTLKEGGFDWNLGDETLTGIRSHDAIEAGGGCSALCPVLWTQADVNSVTGYTNSHRALFEKDGYLKEAFPYLYFDEITATELNSLKTDINSYCDQMLAKFITGEVDIDAGWTDYISTLKTMGADRMIEILQETVNASVNR